MHELPLVFFTVLAQASVGLIVAAFINEFWATPEKSDSILFKSGLMALVVVGLAGIGALSHLGQPFRAANALFGAGRSPMSNEIISCSIYGALLFGSTALLHFKPKLKSLILMGFAATSVAGIAFVFLIPRVYTIETIPQWYTGYTTAQMVLTAFATGGALALIWNQSRINLVITAIGIIASAAMFPSYMTFLSDTASHMMPHAEGFFNTKLLLSGIALIAATFSCQQRKMHLAIAASVLLIFAELLGRIAFYNLWSIGM